MLWWTEQPPLSSSLIVPPQSDCANCGASSAGGNGGGPDPSSHCWCLWPLLLTFGSHSSVCLLSLTSAVSLCPVLPPSPLASPVLTYSILHFRLHFYASHTYLLSLCSSIYFPIPSVSPLSPLLLIFSSRHYPAPPLLPLPSFPNSLLSNTLFSSHQPLSALLSPT